MSLTTGRGPFGSKPAGRFDFDAPEQVVYVEDFLAVSGRSWRDER